MGAVAEGVPLRGVRVALPLFPRSQSHHGALDPHCIELDGPWCKAAPFPNITPCLRRLLRSRSGVQQSFQRQLSPENLMVCACKKHFGRK
eukprot:365942-Chlamydomonas_euryale.AAC.56